MIMMVNQVKKTQPACHIGAFSLQNCLDLPAGLQTHLDEGLMRALGWLDVSMMQWEGPSAEPLSPWGTRAKQ